MDMGVFLFLYLLFSPIENSDNNVRAKMRAYFLNFIIFLLLFYFMGNSDVFSFGSNEQEIKNDYQVLFEQLINLSIDPTQSADVNNIEIKRDVGKFILGKGKLFLCAPVNDRVVAAIFQGEGNFKYTPPSKIEKEHLFRFYEKKSLDEKFDQLFFLFTDSTYNEFLSKLEFTTIDDETSARSINRDISDCLEYVTADDEEYVNSDLIKILLDDKENDFFYTHFDTENHGELFFRINPLEEEQVNLLQRYDKSFTNFHEIINSFPRTDKYVNKADYNISQPFIKVGKYKIDSKIESDLDFSAEAEISFVPLIADQKWINFYLFYDLEVDSVFWGTGESADFLKGEENNNFWIKLGNHNEVDVLQTLKVYYQGELLRKNEFGWVSLRSSNHWFPKYLHEKHSKSYFELSFYYDEKFTLVSVGENIENEIDDDDMVLSKWVTRQPTINASFNVGHFDVENIEMDESVPVNIYMSEGGHSMIAHFLAANGILSSVDLESVGFDIANSFKFFTHIFGQTPVQKIYATEIPYYHGEAFPGLLHLSWFTYQNTEYDGSAQQFRAHEVAHQWWGIQVGYDTYHDKWLSEGLADYSGLWYMHATLKDNDAFFDMLESWKEKILTNRVYLFGSGQEAGPISLGYRTSSKETSGDFDLIIYKKGAWVFHMLRSMLMDLKTYTDEKFIALLQEYYNTYKGKSASTQDFINLTSKHFNEDMTWFFDQWIYGTSIPKYKFAYKVAKTPDGKYKARCRIKQEDVPPDFRMYVNLKIDFGDDRHAMLRINVDGNTGEFDLPVLPMEPEEIIFNDLNSVLCEVEYEDWD